MTEENVKNEVVVSGNMLEDVFGDNGKSSYLASDGQASSFDQEIENTELIGAETKELGDIVNKEIKISKFVAHPVTLADMNTQEERDMVRVVLLTDQGIFSTSSPSVETRLAQYMRLFEKYGLKICEETPLVVEVKQQTTRSGYKVLTLAINPEVTKTYIK